MASKIKYKDSIDAKFANIDNKYYGPYDIENGKKLNKEAHWSDYAIGGLFFIWLIGLIPFIGDNSKKIKELDNIHGYNK